MHLNKAQQSVIEHVSGPLLVVAGAGTGKTAVLVEKMARALKDEQLSGEQLCALTFTQKSAIEMYERLDKLMPLGYSEPYLGTFHSVCERMLRDEGLAVGLDPGYRIATFVDLWLLVKKNLFGFELNYYRPLGNPHKFIGALLGFFSKLADECVSGEELLAFAQKKLEAAENEAEREEAKRLVELGSAAMYFRELKRQESWLDFGDLIGETIRLFDQRPAIAQKYRRQFRWVMVDEFQDTNLAQYRLVQLLCPPKERPNLIVVGDDDQSIYKFRGASVVNILNFKRDYPDALEVVLTENYRSTQEILDGAYRLIQHNNPDRLEKRLAINKRLVANKPVSGYQQGREFANGEAEVAGVVAEIVRLVQDEKISYRDIAILARANGQLEPFVAALKQAGIPYQLVANRGLFDQREVRDLLHFLRAVGDVERSPDLFELLTIPDFGFAGEAVLDVLARAKRQSVSLWELLVADEAWQPLAGLLQQAREKALEWPTSRLLWWWLIESGYLKRLSMTETVENTMKIANINLLFERVKRFEQQHNGRATLVDFLAALEDWEAAGDNPAQATIEDIDTVSLMTVHAAKGLEFEAVFVVGVVAGRFPARKQGEAIPYPDELVRELLVEEGGDSVAEERRLFYVALTRAKRWLMISYALDYGGARARKPSGFVAESGFDVVVEPLKQFDEETSEFSAEATSLLAPDFHVTSVSFTQLDTFAGCPLKYKFRYVLKVPTLPYQSLTFGRSVHETLYEFHRLGQQGKWLGEDEFLGLFESLFDETGYDSEEHKQQRYLKAREDLRRYWRERKRLFGQPLHLERSFSLPIDGVVVKGKIDRIDETPDGLHLVDYKTGSVKSQKEVDKDEQLSLYALAAREVFGLDIARLSLYFVETGEVVTTKRSAEQIEKTKAQLAREIAMLQQSDFPARPNKVRCNYCEYNQICTFRAR